MTGYGKATATLQKRVVTVEIKALNSKYLDLYVRMPQLYRAKELVLRQSLTKKLVRGKVELNINVEELGEQSSCKLNVVLIKQYYTQLKEAMAELNVENEQLMNAVMRLPDVTMSEKNDADEQEWEQVMNLVEEALIKFNGFREQEGSALEKDFVSNVNSITEFLAQIEKAAPERIETIKLRIEQQLNEFKERIKVDVNRFEQEVLYYIEKLDVNEEVVRLKSHCKQFLQELKNNKTTKGKKLGFIAQEIGREINTIGSKANNAEIQNYVVKMKNELEKIKEQVLNIV